MIFRKSPSHAEHQAALDRITNLETALNNAIRIYNGNVDSMTDINKWVENQFVEHGLLIQRMLAHLSPHKVSSNPQSGNVVQFPGNGPSGGNAA